MGKADVLTYSAISEVSDVEDNQNQIVLIPWSLHSTTSNTAIAKLNTLEDYIW